MEVPRTLIARLCALLAITCFALLSVHSTRAQVIENTATATWEQDGRSISTLAEDGETAWPSNIISGKTITDADFEAAREIRQGPWASFQISFDEQLFGL